jgi:dissimilatory sulfite reductase (desulfoviridin) alpha/beta subunit
MTRSEVITNIYALFNAPHNADINIVGLNKVLDDLVSAEREACAEVCKKHADFYAGLEPSPIAQSAWAACIDNRDTILARGQA